MDVQVLPWKGQALDALKPISGAEDIAGRFLLGYSGHTRDAYRADLADWFSFTDMLGVDPLAVSRAVIDLYARHMDETDGRAPSTISRRLSTLSGFYGYAFDEGVIDRNPAARVRRPRASAESQTTGLTRDELQSLLNVAAADTPRSLVIVSVLAFNGLRVGELLSADVDDLGFERGHRVLRIIRKGGKRATVPLAPRTAEAIDSYLNERGDGPLIATNTGNRMGQPSVWKLIRRLAREAGLHNADHLHPHSLRHAFVTLSLDAGASLRDVQDAAGHADPRTTRRYDRARYNLDRHPTYALVGLID